MASGDGALVATGNDAEDAVRAAADDPSIRAIALIDPVLTAEALRLVPRRNDLALLAVADPADRRALRCAVDARLAAAGAAVADLWVGPAAARVDGDVDRWLADAVAAAGTTEPVVFDASDGWQLHGDLLLPGGAGATAPAPGIVLLHSGRTDRAVFRGLAHALVRRGLAVLNLDWRGRGASTNKGRGYYDIDAERADGRLDAAAAFDVLAARPEVAGDRLAALGVAHGAEHAVRGSLGDPRVKALVVLTGFHLAGDDERRRLVDGDLDVLYVTGAAHRSTTDAMRSLHQESRGRRSRFVEVPGGAIGYQLLELHPWLAREVGDWLTEVLGVRR